MWSMWSMWSTKSLTKSPLGWTLQIKSTMKKVFHNSMLFFSLISGIGFFCTFTQSPVDIGRLLYMLFLCAVSTIMFIMTEPRPRLTPKQRQNDDRIKEGGMFNLVLIFITAVVIIVMASCSGSRGGYGCDGRGKVMTRVTDRSAFRH